MINFNGSERLCDYRIERHLERICEKIGAKVAVDRHLNIREVPGIDKLTAYLRKVGLETERVLFSDDRNYRVIGAGRGVALTLEVHSAYVYFTLYSKDLKRCQGIIPLLDKFFEEYLVKSKSKKIIPVDFWHWSGRNSSMLTRLIECPTWDEISTNYVPVAAEEMTRVMTLKKPEETGKVMLWHGDPGTGKTYAVRALLQAWKDGYRPTVIVDPEILFTNSGYLYDVLFDERHIHQSDDNDDLNSNLDLDLVRKKKEAMGKILVLEDMPDLLLKSSRNDKNHAMARLLNLSDGILGQGVKAVFLFTTNQELEEIDPAFTRPGRCLATVKFEKFGTQEATNWIRAKRVERDFDYYKATSPKTIAEMYAILREKSPLGSPEDLEPKKIVGFAVDK